MRFDTCIRIFCQHEIYKEKLDTTCETSNKKKKIHVGLKSELKGLYVNLFK